MPGVVIWDNPDQTILHLRFKDVVTLTDYTRVVEQTNAILHTVTHKVHLLVDARDAWVANGHVKVDVPGLDRGAVEYRGRVVVVNGDTGIKALVLSGLLPEAPQFVGTLDEAYAVLRDTRIA
ncbi:MAG: hypothetical protein SGJ24_00955 [Chloroflexota bacterium]|nr:hypothetical protein [Chloroflexota bacterium]